jgi:hypothetical protein
MASSKKYAQINPRLRLLKKHTLADGKTVITQDPSEVTATQLKEVLEYQVNGQPVAVEVSAEDAKAFIESRGGEVTADNAEGEA